MTRAKTREVSGPSALQAVAAPVNTYVRPADPAPSSLHDLADGLAALDSGLAAFMDKRKGKSDEADKEKAINAFNANHQVAWGEAVKRGMVPPNASPVFQEWYKKSQGNLKGLQLRDKFSLEFNQWEGRNSGDPAQYQEFLGNFLKANLAEDEDPYVLAGLNPHVDQLLTEGYSQFNKERADTVYGGALATQGALITNDITRAEEDGKVRDGGTDYEALWGSIVDRRTEALTKGTLEKDYDAFLVDSILLEADRSGNEDLLKLLDRTLPGSDHAISSEVEVRKKITDTEDRMASAAARKVTSDATEQERQDKARHNELVAGVIRDLAKDPRAVVPEDAIKEIERRDPDFRTKLKGYRENLVGGGIGEDPKALLELYADIHNGATAEDVLEKYRAGIITNPETLTKALDRVEKVKAASGEGGILQSPAYKDTVKVLTTMTTTDTLTNPFGESGLSEEGSQALYEYRNLLFAWEANNPNASILEREKAARELGQQIKESIVLEEGASTGGQYLTPEDKAAQEQQPEEPAAPAPEIEVPEDGSWLDWVPDFLKPSAEEEPAATPEAQPEAAIAPAPLESLPPAQRTAIEALAERHGLSTEEASQLFQERMKALGGGSAEGGGGGGLSSLQDADRTRLETLLRDPPKRPDGQSTAGNTPVAPLLNLIGKTEGTDKGDGYNETLAYGAFTGGDVQLTGMTLDEIDRLQTAMLRHPSNSWNSSAIGRYQIIRTTLRGLREELGLTGGEVFDEKMQDRLAMHLLDRRGLSKWQAGEMSDEQFMSGLSAEWASLPKASGKGTYKGQRVGTRAETLRSILSEVRSGGTQVASLDPASGLASDPYSKIPATDSRGEDQIAKFREWNSDPIGNHEDNLAQLKPGLQSVIRRAQELAGVRFVVGSGVRDEALQAKAVEWGWSQTEDSDHLHGDAVDLWPIDADGAVVFDKKLQTQIVKAMKAAAKEAGVTLDIGADWKGFKDLPHFALKS